MRKIILALLAACGIAHAQVGTAVPTEMTVTCDGTDYTATMRYRNDTPGSLPLVIFFGGGNGVNYYKQAGEGSMFVDLKADGYMTAEIAWPDGWWDLVSGATASVAACLPATVMTVLPEWLDASDYIVVGQSGGSEAIAYAIECFGMRPKGAVLGGGPPKWSEECSQSSYSPTEFHFLLGEDDNQSNKDNATAYYDYVTNGGATADLNEVADTGHRVQGTMNGRDALYNTVTEFQE